MMDLHDRLDQFAGSPAHPDSTQIDADVARGRAALHRRRVTGAVAASATGVAALVAAVAIAAGGIGTGGVGADAGTGTGDRTTANGSVGASADGAGDGRVRLVAYTGAQPKGFTIDTVPDGWFIQTDDNYSLLLAPDRAKNPGPNADPSRDPVYDPQSFVGKIGIMLQSKDAHGVPEGTTVTVGGKDGVLVKSRPAMTPDGSQPPADGDTGWELYVRQPTGIQLIVQFWEGLGLTQDQMIDIGAGVHVHKDAAQGVG
ncbi:hypothetical protein [Mangrovihabitans endophyticus]|uniref:Uncharacterized protein n=1 Tax=Mangrovihabitans endophyticus TaxID=1751298 RepID=A0A8J3FPX7_9ACTN|nr:hypothetical protein [Mangrovihabitans endophyticus]GGL04891.1 hypothetical protein GCM10012284_44360 [Mangrovihabitans endophyticus]